MLTTVYRADLKAGLRHRPFLAYALVVLGFGLIFIGGMAAEDEQAFGGRTLNSLYFLYGICRRVMLPLLLLVCAVVGHLAARDYTHEADTLIYAFPLRRGPYLGGRFLAVLTLVLVLLLLLGAGFLLGSAVPWANPALIRPFTARTYVQLLGWVLLPNAFLVAALAFAATTLTRSAYAGFFVVAVLILFRTALVRFFPGSDALTAALTDPLGLRLFDFYTAKWTIVEQNTGLLPATSFWWINRLGVIGLGLMSFGLTLRRFRFSSERRSWRSLLGSRFSRTEQQGSTLSRTEHQGSTPSRAQRSPAKFYGQNKLGSEGPRPRVHTPSLYHTLRTTLATTTLLFRQLITNPLLWVGALVGLAFLLFLQSSLAPRWGTESLPFTHLLLSQSAMFYAGYVNLCLFLLTGWLVHLDRRSDIHPLIDAQPVANGALLLGRLGAMVGMLLLLLALPLVAGLIVQHWRGFTHFDWDYAFFQQFVLDFLHFLPWLCLAILVHSWLKWPFLAFLLLLFVPVGWIGFAEFAPQFLDWHAFQHPALRYNQSPSGVFGLLYSIVDGYGHGLPLHLYYRLYWTVAGVLLLWVALLLWPRGVALTGRERWKVAVRRANPRWMAGALGLFLVWGALGVGAARDGLLTGRFFSRFQQTEAVNGAIKRYRGFRDIPQPRITAVDLFVDLYPESGALEARGGYLLVNRHDRPVDTLVINYLAGPELSYSLRSDSFLLHGCRQPPNPCLRGTARQAQRGRSDTAISLSTPGFRYLSRDTVADLAHFDVLLLDKPLAAGDSLWLSFRLRHRPTLLSPSNLVRADGTFVRDDIFPRFGNWLDYFRKELELGSAAAPPFADDPDRPDDSFTSRDSDRIDFRATVSTSADQTALSVGRLEAEWTADDRNYFCYRSEGPIAHSFLFLSGRYAIAEARHRGVNLSVYHPPGLDQNVPAILEGMRDGLDYCSTAFGPYPFDHLRTVAFAQTGGVSAHGYPGTQPSGEGSGFLADYDPTDSLATNGAYGTAVHETAHQWWGNLVMAADARGAKLIVESLADYVNVMASRRRYGTSSTGAYLDEERRGYLQTRNRRRAPEVPLVEGLPTENHLFYQKGVRALVTLADLIGEDRLNSGLRRFFRRHVDGTENYPTAAELVTDLRSVTPDTLNYLIDDFFRHVTLYDNRIVNGSLTARTDGNWDVDLEIIVSKYRENEAGARLYRDTLTGVPPQSAILATGDTVYSLPLADYLDVAVYGASGKLLLEKRIAFYEVQNFIRLAVPEKPARVVLDPRRMFFDADDLDNGYTSEDR